jgi:hypothetical protein
LFLSWVSFLVHLGMDLYCDNSGAIAHEKEPRSQKRLNMYHDVIISSVKSLIEMM